MNDPERYGDEARHSTGRIFVFAAAAGVALVLVLSLRREMWLDEYHSWLLSRMSLSDLSTFVRGDVHPPLYFLGLNAWQRIVGDTDTALRLLSLVTYAAGCVVFLHAARRWWGDGWTALVCTLLFVWSPALIFYGSEVRGYAMLVLASSLAMWAWGEALNGHEDGALDRRTMVLLIAASAAAFYVHYTGLFFVAGLGAAWLITYLRGRGVVRDVVVWGVATATAIAVWLPTMFRQRSLKRGLDGIKFEAMGPVAASFPMPDLAQTVMRTAENVVSIMGVYPADRLWLLMALALPFVALVWGALVATRTGDHRAQGALVILLAVLVGSLWIGANPQRRYLLVAAPALFLWLGAGIEHLRRTRAGRLVPWVAVAITATGAVRAAFAPASADFETTVRTLAEVSSPEQPVVVYSAYGQVPIDYHAEALGVSRNITGFPTSVYDWWESQEFKGWGATPISAEETRAWVEALPQDTVWLLEFDAIYQDPHGLLQQELKRSRVVEEIPLAITNRRLFRLFRVTPD